MYIDTFYMAGYHMSHLVTKPTKWHVSSAKTQISLGIRPGWSESSLSAWRKLGSLATHWAHSEDSDQTGRMPRLIWVFAWRICQMSVCWFCQEVTHIEHATLLFKLRFMVTSNCHSAVFAKISKYKLIWLTIFILINAPSLINTPFHFLHGKGGQMLLKMALGH